MSTLLRRSLRLPKITQPSPLPLLTTSLPAWRAYGSISSKRGPIATSSLTPGSQQALTDPTAREEFARADAKMAACVERLRREVAQLEARASGRVTPQLLAPVRITVAPTSSSSASGGKKLRLEELATVGVRDGSTLIVTVFDPQVSLWSCAVSLSRLPLLPPHTPEGVFPTIMGCLLTGSGCFAFQ